jgi:hypothetical protein
VEWSGAAGGVSGRISPVMEFVLIVASVVVVVLAVTGVLGVLIDRGAEPNRTDRRD